MLGLCSSFRCSLYSSVSLISKPCPSREQVLSPKTSLGLETSKSPVLPDLAATDEKRPAFPPLSTEKLYGDVLPTHTRSIPVVSGSSPAGRC